MATDWIALWNGLNQRQQAYLEAVYFHDQRQEANERQRAARERIARPADQWRWIQYDPKPEQGDYDPPLRSALRAAGLIDPGTGSTFEALASRGYIARKWDHFTVIGGVYSVLWVQITPKGRKLIRGVKGYKPPKRRAKGELSPGQWDTLEKLYTAGDQGISHYKLFWPYCLRLRDYNPPLLREARRGEQTDLLFITESGRRFYDERKHQKT